MRTQIVLVMLVLSSLALNLTFLTVDEANATGGGGSTSQKCPTACPSGECKCEGNNCSSRAASCGGQVTCDCSDTNCHTTADCGQPN